MAQSNDLIVFNSSGIVKLNKGMSPNEVRDLLGKESFIESCSDKNDLKLIYQFPVNNGTYILYFMNNQLEWLVNGVHFKKNYSANKDLNAGDETREKLKSNL